MIFPCLSGVPAHVLLKCTGLKPPGELNLVELLSGSGRSLRTIPVSPLSDLRGHGLWSVPEFRTPSQSFFIRVMGKDEEGYRFQRLSSVSYTNVIPGKTTPSLQTHFTKAGLPGLSHLIKIFANLSPFVLPLCRSPSCEHA